MQCPECHAIVPDSARFCGSCGSPVPRVSHCTVCDTELKSGQKFCIKCGTPAGAVPGLLASPPVSTESAARATPASASTTVVPPIQTTSVGQTRAPGDPVPNTWVPSRRHNRGLVIALVIVALSLVLVVGGLLLVELPRIQGNDQIQKVPLDTTTTLVIPDDITAPDALAQAQMSATTEAWSVVLAYLAAARHADPTYSPAVVRDLRVTACTNLAQRAEEEQNLAAVQTWWACVIEENPDDAQAQTAHQRATSYLGGRAQFETQNLSGAIKTWQTLHRQDPEYADVGIQLYAAYLAYGDYLCAQQDVASVEAARTQYGLAQALDPLRSEAVERLANCLVPAPEPTPTWTPLTEPHLAVITNTNNLPARVRSGPGFGYLVLGRLALGTAVTITARTENSRWLQVQIPPDRTGWISQENLQSRHPFAAAPLGATPPLIQRTQVAQVVQDFSNEQGYRQWYYLYSDVPGSLKFDRFPWDSASGRWYRYCCNKGFNPQMRISDNGGKPGLQHDIARKWVSPYEGTLHIYGLARKAESGGNGVGLRIVHKNTSTTDTVWDGTLSSNNLTGISYDINIESQSGDEVFFITSSLGDMTGDNTVFEPTIELVHNGGFAGPAPTPWPDTKTQVAPTATAVTPSQPTPTVCYQARLRHYEPHRGCCAEVAGVAFNRQNQPAGPRGAVVRIEGPPANDRYVREFAVDRSGGYNITALSVNPYTIYLKGPNIRSNPFSVTFPDLANIRMIVDFYQIPCQ